MARKTPLRVSRGVAVLGRLYLDHYPATLVYARWLTVGDQALAEDLAMDACLATWRRMRDCAQRPVADPGAYLRQCVHNLYADHCRHLRHELLRSEPGETYRGAEQRPVEELLDVIALVQLIDRLPVRHREVIWAKAAGATDAEIADALGLSSPEHAAVALHRARAALRAALD